MLPSLSPDRLIELLRQMLRIRRAGEHTVRFLEDGLVHGAIHVSIGQEAAAVGACAALEAGDLVFSNWRNQGHTIARGLPVERVLAEGLAREGGYSGGHGGMVHVADPDAGILHTSGSVGNGVGLAVGAAWAMKELGDPRRTLAFFSEGAFEGGLFYETLNIACLWNVPIVLVMENNAVARGESVPAGARRSLHTAASLSDVAAPFGVTTSQIDGNSTGAVYTAVKAARSEAAQRSAPVFVEARTSRWHGLSPRPEAGLTAISAAWEPETASEPLRAWIVGDPVLHYARELLDAGACTREQLDQIDRDVTAEVDRAAHFARSSPFPPGPAALDHVFARETE